MKFVLKNNNKNEDDDEDEEDKTKIETNVYRENNHIYFYVEINRSSILKLNTLIREAEEYSVITTLKLKIEKIPIHLHIYSSGGHLYSAFSCIDVIKSCSVPIYSVIEGATASAGTLISVVCQKRFIRPSAYMLIHQLSSGCWGKMSEIEDEYKSLTDLMNKITEIYVQHTKIPRNELKSLLQHDLWLDSKKCIKYGLVDELY
jgi:ATP-dependent protease ClpP protease subunit